MYKRLIIVLIASLTVSGCISLKSSSKPTTPAVPASGFFKTVTKGENWVQKGDLYTIGAPAKRITYGDITFIKNDPLDPNTLYLGADTGLYYSYNRGDGWFRTLESKGVVNDIAVDPTDKCTSYAAININIYKSTDCTRSWNLIHFSSLKGQFFTSIIVSKADSNLVFIGASDGTLLYSKNAGLSWEVFHVFDKTIITRMLAHPKDINTFYVITPRYGIQKTTDNGARWTSLHDLPVKASDGTAMLNTKKESVLLKSLNGSLQFNDLQFDPSQTDGLIYASGYGIFRLVNGEYWQEIEILSKPRQETIYTVALDSTGTTIYFATNGAFYRSENSGKDWTVRKLPATGKPRFLTSSPNVVGELYLGFYSPPPKK
jgi:hypothetical protein